MFKVAASIDTDEFFRRLQTNTSRDCYEQLHLCKGRGGYFSGIRGDRFYMYYRPPIGISMFSTYLRGKVIPDDNGIQLFCRYGKENIMWIRALLMSIPFIYAAYLLQDAAGAIALVFLICGIASIASVTIHMPEAKKRLYDRLSVILSDTSKHTDAISDITSP